MTGHEQTTIQMKETILLVYPQDDIYVSRFKGFFEEKGATVIHAADFDAGYKVLESNQVDIVVVNLDINYDAGFKFCYRIKKNCNLAKAFVIGLSAASERFGVSLRATTADEKRWLNLDLYVNMPITAKNLYLLLKKEIAMMKGLDTTVLDTKRDCQE
jgi:response regulator RpfG family c-di-GMP phosphodiesterase